MEPLRLKMLQDEPLKSFWEFATTVRRTHSLADRESRRIRGAWLAPHLAVQRVHGWGLRSVRLLCVSACTSAQQERLQFFFEKDKRNLEGRLVDSKDPLDTEPRVLVKVPYENGLDNWVQHEWRVLNDIAGLESVPKLHQPLFFEDINILAAAYEYYDAPSLQQQLEGGKLVQREEVHMVAAFILKTLSRIHARGWLHTDLQPKDILLTGDKRVISPADGRDSSADTGSVQDETESVPVVGRRSQLELGIGGLAGSGMRGAFICGWSRAVPCSEAVACSGSTATASSIIDFIQSLPVSASAVPPDDVSQTGGDAGSENAAKVDDEAEQDLVSSSTCARELASPSLYAAPEQLVGLFAGVPYVSPATDIYRMAAILLMATCAHGPMGVQGRLMGRNAASDVDALRRLCKKAILRRAEYGERTDGSTALANPSAEEVTTFTARIGRLLSGRLSLHTWRIPELVPWLERTLAREPHSRYQSVDEALEALDQGWSDYELSILQEVKAMEVAETLTQSPSPVSDDEAQGAQAGKKERRKNKGFERLVFEPPPELQEMTVL